MGVYPFMFGALKDFEPVVNELIKVFIQRDGMDVLSKHFNQERNERTLRLECICRDLFPCCTEARPRSIPRREIVPVGKSV